MMPTGGVAKWSLLKNFSLLRRLALAVCVVAAVMLGLPAWIMAESPLASYEQHLFGTDFDSEVTAERLARLERYVLGMAQTGSEAERLARLEQLMRPLMPNVPNSSVSNSSVPSSSVLNPAPAAVQQALPLEQRVQRPPLERADATDYPAVGRLEMQVFGRSFPAEDIQVRLTRLERQVFRQTFDQQALVDRVDRLDLQLSSGLSSHLGPGGQFQSADSQHVGPPAGGSVLDGLPTQRQWARPQQVTQANPVTDAFTNLGAMEQYWFGRTFPDLLVTERLDLLERKALGQTFDGESISTRLQRLDSRRPRASAMGSPGVSQGMQPQGAQSRPAVLSRMPYASMPYASGSSAPTGLGSAYSPEMLQMLPPHLRQQMLGGYSQGGTVLSAPSVVILPPVSRQTTTFQTFGTASNGVPIQQQYSGSVATPFGVTTTTRQQQVQLQGGGSVVYEETVEQPAYGGYPVATSVLQQLMSLETQVLGQPQTTGTLPYRLDRLEAAVLGQNYTGYPTEQRLAQVQRAYQLQAAGQKLGQGTWGKLGRTAGSVLLGVPLSPPAPATNLPGTPIPDVANPPPGLYGW
ncbi:MAG: hypothetical protein SFZ03_01300 [Candidatus Melainabacteria bacterium]|nr:hypothetical protein [Candidatus Melainabacteria bacterium]